MMLHDGLFFFFCFVKKSLEEFWVAERALENSLALRNSFRRDLLRKEMDQQKYSLEIPSPLHIRILKIIRGINKCLRVFLILF